MKVKNVKAGTRVRLKNPIGNFDAGVLIPSGATGVIVEGDYGCPAIDWDEPYRCTRTTNLGKNVAHVFCSNLKRIKDEV